MRGVRSVLLLLVLVALPGRAAADSMGGADKAQHFAVSLGLSGAAYTGLRLLGRDPPLLRVTFSVGLALVPGLLKEIYDSGRPKNFFSGRDLAWDAIGAVTGALIAFGVDLLIARLRAAPRPRRARATMPPPLPPERSWIVESSPSLPRSF